MRLIRSNSSKSGRTDWISQQGGGAGSNKQQVIYISEYLLSVHLIYLRLSVKNSDAEVQFIYEILTNTYKYFL